MRTGGDAGVFLLLPICLGSKGCKWMLALLQQPHVWLGVCVQPQVWLGAASHVAGCSLTCSGMFACRRASTQAVLPVQSIMESMRQCILPAN